MSGAVRCRRKSLQVPRILKLGERAATAAAAHLRLVQIAIDALLNVRRTMLNWYVQQDGGRAPN